MLILLAGDLFVDFDSGESPARILFHMWRAEHEGPEERKRWEKWYKSKYPEDYERFIEIEEIFVKWTPNIKQMYLDYLDGKCNRPDWELFEEALKDAFK